MPDARALDQVGEREALQDLTGLVGDADPHLLEDAVTLAVVVLARSPDAITLGQIVSAVDGPISAGDFGLPHTNGACDHEGQCALLDVWSEVGQRMRAYLDSYTLADMVERATGLRAPVSSLT